MVKTTREIGRNVSAMPAIQREREITKRACIYLNIRQIVRLYIYHYK